VADDHENPGVLAASRLGGRNEGLPNQIVLRFT
jgi:hypothetical protein